jgi:hypothetical protein
LWTWHEQKGIFIQEFLSSIETAEISTASAILLEAWENKRVREG